MENQEIEELKSTVNRLEGELVAKSKKLNLYEVYLIITLLLIIMNLFLVIYFFKKRPTGRPILQASGQASQSAKLQASRSVSYTILSHYQIR